jgi:iron uptake system component EfeO
MRANVAAGQATFAAFTPWLREKDGAVLITDITAGFDRLQAAYMALPGDDLPEVPATFSALRPTEADLQTTFGKLWKILHTEADDTHQGSLVSAMLAAAELLGIPELP